jgi:hypothetical protein
MNKREAAIVAAYTGYLIGSFSDMHKYIEEIMGGPIWTHEMADKRIMDEIQKRAKKDFIQIKVEDE